VPQNAHRLQQLGRGGAPYELDPVQHLRDELAQVPVGAVQRGQMAAFAGLRPLGQVVPHPVGGLALPRRDGLVEQLHGLVTA
jgi:hypothetical protein